MRVCIYAKGARSSPLWQSAHHSLKDIGKHFIHILSIGSRSFEIFKAVLVRPAPAIFLRHLPFLLQVSLCIQASVKAGDDVRASEKWETTCMHTYICLTRFTVRYPLV